MSSGTLGVMAASKNEATLAKDQMGDSSYGPAESRVPSIPKTYFLWFGPTVRRKRSYSFLFMSTLRNQVGP
jgi:hypothetical protein